MSSQKELPFNHANRLPQPVCTWSAHAPLSKLSPSPFPRNRHTLTATSTGVGDLLLFGGRVRGYASGELYAFSTRDFSTTLLQTKGEVPDPRYSHGAALTDSTLLICGGETSYGNANLLNHNSLYLLNLVSREWTHILANNPGPGCRNSHTTTVVNSKLFVFGGKNGWKAFNDMWILDLNRLKSQPRWESYDPPSLNKKPPPRFGHVSVTTEDRIIIFGGTDYRNYYNDTWSFDISTRKWTKLECTGSIPPARGGHAAVLVDDFMYVFGGCTGITYPDDFYALWLSGQQWFKFLNAGSNPYGRSYHTMASEGTRIFVIGGYSKAARVDETPLIHVFDRKDIKYPKPEPNALNPNEKTTQRARISSAVSLTAQTERDKRITQLTDELALKSALLEEVKASAVEGERRARLELRERDDRLLAQTSLVKQRDAELVDMQSELRNSDAKLFDMQLKLTNTDPKLVDMQSKLTDTEAKLDQSLLSCDEQIQRYRAHLANVRVELEAKEAKNAELEVKNAELEVKNAELEVKNAELEVKNAELEAKNAELDAVRKANAGTFRIRTAASLVDLNEDRSMYGLKEDDLESLQCNE